MLQSVSSRCPDETTHEVQGHLISLEPKIFFTETKTDTKTSPGKN